MTIFKNRTDAGKVLAEKLKDVQADVVLGIPRGGVVVAKEVAKALNLPLDVVITRKIGDPLQKELALGAVDPNGEVVWNKELLRKLNLNPGDLKEVIDKEKEEVKRRKELYRAGKTPLKVGGKVVILVDDGIATGKTCASAVRFLKTQGAEKVIAAAPLALSKSSLEAVSEADQVIVLYIFDNSCPVGSYYESFPETSDEEVIKLFY